MIEVYVSGTKYTLKKNSYAFEDRVSEKSYCEFILETSLSKQFMKYERVTVYKDGVVEFKGLIKTSKHKNILHMNYREHRITCFDNHFFVSSRRYTKVHYDIDAGYSGNIVKAMIDNVLYQEGITYTVDSIDNGIWLEKVFNYTRCDDAMDSLIDVNPGYIWWIDNDKVLHFKDATTVINPNSITYKDMLLGSLNFERKSQGYRNDQKIKGARTPTEEISNIFQYSGETNNFTLSYKVDSIKSIKVSSTKDFTNGVVTSFEEKTLTSLTDNSTNFFFTKYDDVLTYNTASNFINEGSWLEVRYHGSVPIIAQVKDYNQINQLKVLTGGSGIIEDVSVEANINSFTEASSVADSKIQKYASLDSMAITFKTRNNKGYKPGQLIPVYLPEDEIDDQFLIEEVNARQEDSNIIYDIKLVKGTLFKSWSRWFQKKLEKAENIFDVQSELQEEVVVTKEYTRQWNATDMPNPFYVWSPSPSIAPGPDLAPTLYADESVYYIEILYSDEEGDKSYIKGRMQQDIFQTYLSTYFYINPLDVVGTWKQINVFTKTGVQMHSIQLDVSNTDADYRQFTKTAYESVQIHFVDLKWS
jgi:hypothetical protein